MTVARYRLVSVDQRQVRDVADVALVRRRRGEVPLEQIGDRLPRRLGDRGADAALLDVAGDVGGTHDTRDPLVVHPLTVWGAVVELGSHTGRADRVVGLVDLADPRLELGIGGGPLGPSWGSCLPRVVGRALDLEQLAQSLHPALDEVTLQYSRAANELWKFCTLGHGESAARIDRDEQPVDWSDRGARRRRLVAQAVTDNDAQLCRIAARAVADTAWSTPLILLERTRAAPAR